METILDYIYYAIFLAAIASGVRTILYVYTIYTAQSLNVKGHSQIMAAIMTVVTIAMFLLMFAFKLLYLTPAP